jgi:hypothetical protein
MHDRKTRISTRQGACRVAATGGDTCTYYLQSDLNIRPDQRRRITLRGQGSLPSRSLGDYLWWEQTIPFAGQWRRQGAQCAHLGIDTWRNRSVRRKSTTTFDCLAAVAVSKAIWQYFDTLRMKPQPSTKTPVPTATRGSPDGGTRRDPGLILAAIALGIAVAGLALTFVLPGPAGPTGASYTVGAVLHHGQSETGVYSAYGGNASGVFGDTINFRIPLGSNLSSSNTTFLATGSVYAGNCPGPGQALAGQLCVYETAHQGRSVEDPSSIFNPYDGGYDVAPWGFGVDFLATASGSMSYGTWTVAAP